MTYTLEELKYIVCDRGISNEVREHCVMVAYAMGKRDQQLEFVERARRAEAVAS